jgi:hypothetical protein
MPCKKKKINIQSLQKLFLGILQMGKGPTIFTGLGSILLLSGPVCIYVHTYALSRD